MKRIKPVKATTTIPASIISTIQRWIDTSYEDFEDEITDYAQSEGLPIDTDLIEEIASDYANKTVKVALEEGVTFNKDDLGLVLYGLAEYAATYDYYTEAEDKYKASVE